MNALIRIIMLLVASTAFCTAMAGEPPETVSLRDKIRASTLIVIGKVDEVAVVDAKSLKPVKGHRDLAEGEKLLIRVKIESILYPPSATFSVDGMTKNILVGHKGLTVDIFSQHLKKISMIYFLTFTPNETGPYFYPFYDWTNLYAPLNQENEVIRLVTAFGAVK